MATSVELLIVVFLWTIDMSGTECSSTDFMDMELLVKKAGQISNEGELVDRELKEGFWVMPSLQFTCSGSVTSLLLGVIVKPGGNEYPSIELWRRTSTSPLIRYDRVSGSERNITLDATHFSTTGPYEYNLALPLSYNDGDVLAVRQPGANARVKLYQVASAAHIIYKVPYYFTANASSLEDFRFQDVLISPITTTNCSVGFLLPSMIRKKSRGITRVADYETDSRIRFPDIQIKCSGNVTDFVFGAKRNKGRKRKLYPELQIWQQNESPSFTHVIGSTDGMPMKIGNNQYKYTLTTPIPVQYGDYLGIYQPDTEKSKLVLYYQEYNGPSNYDSGQDEAIGNQNNYPLVSVVVVPILYATSTSSMDTASDNTRTTQLLISTTLTTATAPMTTEALQSTANELPTTNILSSLEPTATSAHYYPMTLALAGSLSMSDVVSTMDSITLQRVTSIPAQSTVKPATVNTIAGAPTNNGIPTPTRDTVISHMDTPSQHIISSHIAVTVMSTDFEVLASTNTINTGSPNRTKESNGSIAAAVIVPLVIVLILAIVVVLILILAMYRRRLKHISAVSYNDDIYGHLVQSNESTLASIRDRLTVMSPMANPVYGTSDVIPLNKVDGKTYEDVLQVTTKSPPYTVVSLEADNRDASPTSDDIIGSRSVKKCDSSRGIYVPTSDERKHITNNKDINNHVYFQLSSIQHMYAVLEETNPIPNAFFSEESLYWEPEANITGIYDQLATKRYREILRSSIEITEHLGSGEFGTVDKGIWTSSEPVEVAIKQLNKDAKLQETVKFLQEAAIMGQFHHPNVVKLHGVVTVGEPIMIVLEYMPLGDMREYLRKMAPIPGEMIAPTIPTLLLSYCRQIASGMEYLSKKSFVHRDLAARNILVASQDICKIADFGMSRDLSNETYYISNAKKIPIKWTAPEALYYKKYSTASDVWSFGAVMYEIWSLGHKPFEGHTNQECMKLIDDGYRLPPPPGCPKPLYEIMIKCWHPKTSCRPSFATLVSQLSQPDSQLIQDTSTVLGGPLETGYNLYPELQELYT